MINDEDRNWFSGLLQNKIIEYFGSDTVSLVADQIILFSDFIGGSSETKSYARITNTNEVNYENLNIVFFKLKINYDEDHRI